MKRPSEERNRSVRVQCLRVSRVLPALCLLAAGCAGLLGRAAAPERNPSDEWFDVRISGNKIGWHHVHEADVERDGRTVWYAKESSEFHVRRGEDSFDTTSTEILWREPDGRLIRLTKSEKDGDQTTTLDVEVKGGTVQVTRTLNGKTDKTLVLVPKGETVYEVDERMFRVIGFEPGRTYEYTTFSDGTMKLEKEAVKVGAKQKYRHDGRDLDAWFFTSTSTAHPGVELKAVCSTEFELLRETLGPIELVRTSEEQARRFPKEAADIDTSVPVEPPVPAWSNLDLLVLRITIRDDAKGGLIEKSPYVRVIASGPGMYEVALRKQMPPSPCDETLPVRAETDELRQALAPTLMFQSDHPDIAGLAKTIVGPEKNALRAAGKICDWVYVNIGQESTKTASASALETLRAKKGDCSEFAALFCTLARAAGIPARQADGVTYRGDGLWFHAWSEVYLGGRWVPVDATLNRVGLPAGSIRLDTFDGSASHDRQAGATLSFLGRARAEITSVTRRGETFDPRKADEALVRTPTTCYNRLGDFTVRLDDSVELEEDGSGFVTQEDLNVNVEPLATPILTDKEWALFLKPAREEMTKRGFKELASGRGPAGGRAYWFVRFEGAIGGRQIIAETRLYAADPGTLVVFAKGFKDVFEKHPDAVAKAFDRVTPGPPKAVGRQPPAVDHQAEKPN